MNDRPFSDFDGGCALPLLQSLVTGILSSGIVCAIAALTDYPRWQLAGLLGGTAAACLQWILSLAIWRNAQLSDARPFYPAQAEEEAEQPAPLRVEVTEGRSTKLIDLPASQEQIIPLAVGLLSGQSLSEAAWTGSGAPFTRSEFSRLRGELIRRGLAAWNNPKTPARGATLTAPGRAVMRRYASMVAD